ncbi:hypothetical protein CK203_026074 [Vitis vinifera]|uniref:Uncharacterized protein n=1 Tax=Vitis vinifera TaxID=29760 RepID=A0A438IJJ5_VITVI|nr:hypothetical protein CK203_026074 [Vitis vinifera]
MADLSRTTNKDTIWCTYCKKPRHTRDQRWKLYGKPQTSSKDCVNSNGNDHTELDKEEIEKLKNLLGTLESPSGACSLAQSGKYSPSLAFSVWMSFLGS